MKRLWIGIIVLLIGLVGLGGFLFWRMKQIVPKPESTASFSPAPQIPPVDESLKFSTVASGTYLLYQTTTISDRGKQDWANDDIQETKFYRRNILDGSEQLISTSHLRSDQGGAVAQIYGKDVLFHRYNGPDDAIISLDGTVTQKKSEWGTFRSKDGRFEVHFTSIYDDPKMDAVDIRVLDRTNQTEKKLFFTKKDFNGSFVVPVAVSLDGSQLFVQTSSLYESSLGINKWSISVETGVKTNISPTEISPQKNETMNTQLYPEQQMMLVSVYGTKPCEDCMGEDTPSAPSKIYLYSIPQKTLKLILEDKDFLISPVRLSEDATLLAYGINNENIWITPFNAPRSNDQNITQGILLDWMENGVVVERKGGDVIYLDSATKKITELGRSRGSYNDADFQGFEYIGAVKLPR